MKGQPTECETMYANHMSDKGLTFPTIQKQKDKLNKMLPKNWNKHFYTKDIRKWPIST